MKKLFCIDLDGTTLIGNNTIHPKMIEAAKHIKDCGHILIIATGRNKPGAIKFYNELNLDTPLITCNGASIYHPTIKEFNNYNHYISEELIDHILKNIGDDLDNCFYSKDHLSYMVNEDSKLRNAMGDIAHGIQIRNLDVKDELHGILLTTDLSNICNVYEKLSASFPNDVFRLWDEHYNVIDVNSKKADKWFAIKEVASYYGILEEHIYTFGDSINDMMMIELCENSYAVANAHDKIAKVSKNHLKETNLEGAVANYLLNIK